MVPCVDGALILLKADYHADAERLRLQAMSTSGDDVRASLLWAVSSNA
jgi:hypothetical protein